MLIGLVFRSGHLKLSGQFDKDRGDEKSARNLAWSDASLLARAGQDRPERAG